MCTHMYMVLSQGSCAGCCAWSPGPTKALTLVIPGQGGVARPARFGKGACMLCAEVVRRFVTGCCRLLGADGGEPKTRP